MLRTPTPEAEQIKVRYACALAQLATSEESIQVPSVGDRAPRRLPRQSLAQAVQARYEEIFEMVQAELRRSGFEQHVRAGMVLTGGASKMEGVVELAEEMLPMPVDRKSVVEGKSVSVRVDPGGGLIIKKKKQKK